MHDQEEEEEQERKKMTKIVIFMFGFLKPDRGWQKC